MPELPDIETYLAALRPRVVGEQLERVRLVTPFLLRSIDPPLPARARIVRVTRTSVAGSKPICAINSPRGELPVRREFFTGSLLNR